MTFGCVLFLAYQSISTLLEGLNNNSATMRTRGSKNSVSLPSSYDTGWGEVNFWQAILAQAYKDVKWHYAKEMVEAFEQTDIGKEAKRRRELELPCNVDVAMIMETAWWVVEYVNERWSG